MKRKRKKEKRRKKNHKKTNPKEIKQVLDYIITCPDEESYIKILINTKIDFIEAIKYYESISQFRSSDFLVIITFIPI